MSDQESAQKPASAIVLKVEGNVDGKGVSGLLLDWQQSRPTGVAAKPRRQILAELFTSTLVLTASFKYKPVVGASNSLYWVDGGWSLSLIAPTEWSPERRAGFAGTCVLQPDMTWTIDPAEHLTEVSPVSEAIARFYEDFALTLDTDLTLEEILPSYVAKLPYYQRLFASALSHSVRKSLVMGDQAASSCRDWQQLLPQSRNVLLDWHD